MSEIDRIMLAAKREEIVARKAKVNLKTPTGGLTSAKLPKSQKPVNTRRECAKAAGVGERGRRGKSKRKLRLSFLILHF